MKKGVTRISIATMMVIVSIIACSNGTESNNKNISGTAANNINNDSSAEKTPIKLHLITDQVNSPTAMGVPGDGSNRLFVCQKEGKVWLIQNDKLNPTPFLDVSDQMVHIDPAYDERGLLGIAFHPSFKSNRKFYVYYSAPANKRGVNNLGTVAEYEASANNASTADQSSKRILLQVEEPESNHNGGCLAFGDDGYLYISLGDGGGGGDKHGSIGNGQNLSNLLATILRIDVNGEPYSIPKDNPFVNKKDARPEIYAYGLRNPWRFSFDRQTHELYAGDVGQNKYEEVDIINKGGNYGWRIKEGFHDYNVPAGGVKANLLAPIYEYGHDKGISITGGYVYRGKAIPELQGKYVYGDYNGSLWVLSKQGGKWVNSDLDVAKKPGGNMQLYSWGEDEAGELYMLTYFSTSNGGRGAVYKLVK